MKVDKRIKEFFENLPKVEILKMTSLSEFEEPFSLMFELYMTKNRGYGASWRKRGIPSSFENISRKYDRLLVQVENCNFHPENLPQNEKVDFFDTAVDLAVYAYLFLWFVYDLFGEEVIKEWRRKVGLENE